MIKGVDSVARIPYPNQYDDEFFNIFKKVIDVINDKGEQILADAAFTDWLNENGMKHKGGVQTFSDLPKNPEENEIRRVMSENRLYIYTGGSWMMFLELDFTEVNNLQAEFDAASGTYPTLTDRLNAEEGYISTIENRLKDWENLPQTPKPAKDGVHSNSEKLIYKNNSDGLIVYQKKNKGYVRHEFKRGTGGSGYGVNYELLRLIDVKNLDEVVAYISPKNPSAGSISETFSSSFPSSTSTASFLGTGNISDKGYDHVGETLDVMEVSSGGFASYSVNSGNTGKINIGLYDRAVASGNTDYKIYFGNSLVKTGSVSTRGKPGRHIIEFNVPPNKSDTLKIENSGSGDLYLTAINFYRLEELNGQQVDSFLAYYGNNNTHYIESNGASDYALRNADDNKLFGSYHGGEISEECKVVKGGSRVNYDTISTGDFWTERNFNIYQKTRLIEKAKMQSTFIFDTDGTLDMDFQYNVIDINDPINLSTYWVGLTCTSPQLSLLKTPIEKDFGTPEQATASHYYFDTIFGKVIQASPDGKTEMHSRFPIFSENSEWIGNTSAHSISDQTIYRKHYYGPIRFSDIPVPLKMLQTSKSLDFYAY